jgi:nucleoside-diphosphate-sugar epimerase
MDAVSAIFKILKEGITGEAYNVGNQNSVISIHDLALTIAASQNLHVRQEQPSKQEAKGYSKPQNIILSNRKLCALGWNGKFNISKGILSTIKILTQFQKMSKSNIEL